MKAYLAVFLSVLLAELGDKTQLATVLFAGSPGVSRLGVFLAAGGALVLATAAAVLVGAELARWIAPRYLRPAAGLGFVAIGLWLLLGRGA